MGNKVKIKSIVLNCYF